MKRICLIIVILTFSIARGQEIDLQEKYKNWKVSSDSSRQIEIERQNKQQKKEAEKIESLITIAGGTNFETNNYWFHFTYKGSYVDFVNQTDRICVTVYDAGLSHDYKNMVDNRYSMPDDLRDELDKEVGYQNFIINDNPVNAVRKLLSRI